jgi:glutamine synthetase
MDPGDPVDVALLDTRPDPTVNGVRLPRNLLEATDAFARS